MGDVTPNRMLFSILAKVECVVVRFHIQSVRLMCSRRKYSCRAARRGSSRENKFPRDDR